MDPDQTAPIAVSSGSILFEQEDSKKFRQMTKSFNICYDWRFKGYE